MELVDMTVSNTVEGNFIGVRIPSGSYSFLLGMYLGDGYVAKVHKTYCLRLHLNTKYPHVTEKVVEACRFVFPDRSTNVADRKEQNVEIVYVYDKRMPDIFPHGEGIKHSRYIKLKSWQESCRYKYPEAFFQGLILSDGCCYTNRVGKYSYVSYNFANKSGDIRCLFVEACDMLDIPYKETRHLVNITTRKGVEKVQEVLNCGFDSRHGYYGH